MKRATIATWLLIMWISFTLGMFAGITYTLTGH
jgi:hypothetical protein